MRTLRCENASPFGENAFDTITLKSIKSYKKYAKKELGLSHRCRAAQNGKKRWYNLLNNQDRRWSNGT